MEREGMSGFIYELRKEKNMTQKQLAEAIGLTDKAVSKWERGQGYPDIASLPLLAETLGVTVGELLDGKRAQAPAAQTEELVETALHYAQKVTVAKHKNIRAIWFFIISGTFILAAMVCVICDIAITRRLTWSRYPIVSMGYAWLVAFPLLYFKKQPLFGGLVSASAFLLPFLFCIERIGGEARWFMPLGAPLALAAIVYLWVVWWLCCRTKLGIWFKAALATVLTIPLDLSISMIVANFAGGPASQTDDIIEFAAAGAMALLLFAIGCFLRKKN